MFYIVFILLGGICLGYLLRRFRAARLFAEKMSLTVALILFVFGVTIGSSPEIIEELPALGLQAFCFAATTILGSAVCAWLLLRSRKSKRSKGGNGQ